MRVVGYIRVSTEEQHLGPEAQLAAMRRWCKANGAELADVYTDHGVSGGAELDKRPALMRAIDALRPAGAEALLVAKRDRLARDVFNAALLERLVTRERARIVSADGTANGTGPEDVLFRQIIDAFAQYERALIRARTKNALAVKRARGEKTGGDVPYGYTLDPDGVHLQPCPAEQAMVAAAARWRAEGLSLRRIGAALAAEGYLPRHGGDWSAPAVARLLQTREAA